jgi:two-component system response regulator FixJ
MMKELEPTVFIVDADGPTLKDLEVLLQSVRLRTETYLSAEDFFGNYHHSRPGCLILNDRLPGVGGIGAYRRLRQEGDHLPVIFLTGHGTVATAVRAMREGAFDFLEKPLDHQYLIDRVQAAIAQDRDHRRQRAEHEGIARRFQALSARELAVLDGVVSGQTSKAIARTLGIEPKTVDVHRANIMRKVGVVTPTDLVYLALQSGHSRERPFSYL